MRHSGFVDVRTGYDVVVIGAGAAGHFCVPFIINIIKGVWPFMIAQLAVLFLMVLFPPLVTVPAKWFGG